MRKIITVLLLTICGFVAGRQLLAQDEARQPVILRVYVQPLEGPDADLVKSVRSKLVDELIKHGIVLSESAETADVVLSGRGVMQSAHSIRPGHHPFLRVRGSMRMVNKNGVAFWVADVSSSPAAVSESASFVERVGKGVTDALSAESKRLNGDAVAKK